MSNTNDFYTFIVSSTINTNMGVFDPPTRLAQTIDTLDSIRAKVPNSKIVLVDNSIIPLDSESRAKLQDKSDVMMGFQHNIFTVWANDIGSKGIGECYIMDQAMEYILRNDLIGKRIFKIAGRYKLNEGFDISEYEKPEYYGKYAFRINPWEVSSKQWEGSQVVWYFETRLYSLCSSLYNEYRGVIYRIFNSLLSTGQRDLMCNWEMMHFYNVPHQNVKEMKPIYVEGLNAVDGVYRFE